MLVTRVQFLGFLVWFMLRFGLLSFLRFPKSRQFHGLNTNLELPFINLVVKREML